MKSRMGWLFDERPLDDEEAMTIEGLDAQLRSLYEDREFSTDEHVALRETVDNLERQLVSLYEERENQQYVSGFSSAADIAASARSFEEQLHALYEEQSKVRYGVTDANFMVDSLEQQVAALLEERNELAEELAQTRLAAADQRLKARDLITAVFDRAIT